MKIRLLALSLIIYCTNIYCQNKITNDTLNEIIISENRLQIPFSKTARNIQIITSSEIKLLPVKSINEVLNLIAGVDLRQRGPFGSQADISIDGGSFEQTLILLNGIKISDAQTAHHSLNIPVPLDAIERIEVLKGAAARIYGINALTGAVNIVTKNAKNNEILLNAYAGSSFKNREENDKSGKYWGGGTQIYANLGSEKQNHLLAFSHESFNGQRYNTASKNIKGFYQGNINLKKQNNLNLMLGHIDNEFGANGFYAAPGDKESFELVKTTIASFGGNLKIGDKLFINPRISNRYNEDDYRYFKHNLNTARSQHYSNAFTSEIQANYNTNFGTFGLGWESRWENIQSSNIGSHNRKNHGFYTEFKKDFKEKLIFNIGAYLNYNSSYGWEIFPGIDIAYKIIPNWKITTNIGSSQRIPSFTDLYLNQRPGNIGNPNLNSEKAWQYELSFKYQKEFLHWNSGYFYRNINDFIDWIREDTTTPYQPQNTTINKTHGLYTQFKNTYQINNFNTINFSASYYYINPEKMEVPNGNISKYVVENLKHQVISNIGYIYKNFAAQITYRYQKRQLNDGYQVVDTRFNYDFNKITIYTDCTNLFNTTYKEIAAVPMPTRWLTLGIKYKWEK